MEKPDEPREADRSDGVLSAGRRPYWAPELIEYGSVAKLTQTGSMFGFDANVMMTGSCL